MFRIEIERLRKRLEIQNGKKYTNKELSALSGCDKNVLSRITNSPQVIPSATVIDKLAQFFFTALENHTVDECPHQHMKEIILDMVQVFPDHITNEKISLLKPIKTVSVTVLWEFV